MPDADVDTEAEFRSKLTPEQYDVLRRAGTERPFSGEYVYSKDSGMYHCAACGAELFSSDTKFDSGTGWPSFTEPATAAAVDLDGGSRARHAAHRGHVQELRVASRARLPRRPERGRRHALLHQLALAPARARREALLATARGPPERGCKQEKNGIRFGAWSRRPHERP